MFLRDLDEDFEDAMNVSTIRHAHRDLEAAKPIRQRLIHDFRRDEVSVRNDDLRSVERAHNARAGADPLDYLDSGNVLGC